MKKNIDLAIKIADEKLYELLDVEPVFLGYAACDKHGNLLACVAGGRNLIEDQSEECSDEIVAEWTVRYGWKPTTGE